MPFDAVMLRARMSVSISAAQSGSRMRQALRIRLVWQHRGNCRGKRRPASQVPASAHVPASVAVQVSVVISAALQ